MKSQFGKRVRTLSEKENLYLRQVAPLLEMDTAQMGKIEKGLQQFKWKLITILADNLKVSSDELMKAWLAKNIYTMVID